MPRGFVTDIPSSTTMRTTTEKLTKFMKFYSAERDKSLVPTRVECGLCQQYSVQAPICLVLFLMAARKMNDFLLEAVPVAKTFFLLGAQSFCGGHGTRPYEIPRLSSKISHDVS